LHQPSLDSLEQEVTMNLREPDFEPIPGYRLIEPLGSGGFGEVWKCEAPGGLFKAIKFVYGNLNSLDVDGARAEQERTALQRVKEVRHPFVLSLERIEEVDGELLIVMELADKSLHDLYVECQSAGLVGVPRDDLLRYMRDAAEGLDYMNEKHNLQHLDVKPRNLFLQGDRVKVADFGLVKQLERSSASGLMGAVTPLYAPPETFTGKISGRSDQYSLAVVYHELLTGTRPFDGKNVRVLAQQHMLEEPDVRALPEAERPVLLRALAKDPARRYPNCIGFVRALHAARSQARPDSIAVPAAGDNRPRSICDTMEDVFLEQAEGADCVVDLGGPARADEDEVSKLGLTIAQPQTGALRPTLVIGIGALGRRAMLELRCRFIDRFGDMKKLPLVRFLYLDCDADAVKSAVRGSPEVALQPHEVYHLPLQQIAHYRRRHLDHLNDWLPREKLHALPRSLTPQGSRALGRLAFADNHQRLNARLRKEVQQVTHPDALYQTVDRTGLAVRDSVPRVYVIAGAGGGGSGFLVDLGYAVRRLLKQLRQAEAPMTAFLLCGAPDDPATPPAELANVYATLTEVNHFADPANLFRSQYGIDSKPIEEAGTAFDAVYLLTQANRSPEARRDAVAHLGSYLFHELSTPLGLRLDRGRQVLPAADATPFRSLGTYGVWFPRGLMLRLAGREACKRLLEEWQATGEPTATAEVEAACARVLADPDLRPEALTARIEAEARGLLEGTPGEALARMLATLEEQAQQSLALDDPGNWARQALTRVREWCGAGLSAGPTRETGEWRKSRLSRALEAAAQKLAAEWDARLAETAFALMEHPGRRVAAAESALARFVRYCSETAQANAGLLTQQSARAQHAQQHLEAALTECVVGAGGFSFFGGKSRRLLRVFMDHLAAYARQCLIEDLGAAVQQFLAALDGKLHERLRDLSFCRQRLRHLQLTLEAGAADEEEPPHGLEASPNSPLPSTESFWDAIRQSGTTRVVLPGGESDLTRAAARFLVSLGSSHWGLLDQALQDGVLGPLGGLHRACTTSADLMRSVAAPLLEQAAACLGANLPVTDVAQVEFALAQAAGSEVGAQADGYFRSAVPLVASRTSAGQFNFLLIPAGEPGKAYGEAAQKVLADLQVVKVPGQADLMFCREQGPLSFDDLERVLKPCRTAYESTVSLPQASAHARFDILDWMPLAP
jgi:serine/threonine protein kinase